MPLFPKIAGPCPYKSDLAAVMDGDHCRMCDRKVFDLTAMTDGERLAFLAACTDQVCVSYSIPIRPALAAAALAAAIASPSAAAARAARNPPPPVPIMVPVVGNLPPAPFVQIVEVPKEASPADVRSLYEEPAQAEPAAKRPAAKPPGN